jgi:REP element-mobilizing transposase RayT
MSNHVHILILPRQPPTRVLQWLKGTTARESNLILARTGQELERIVAYIEDSPVKAGLAAQPSLYRWSSASQGDGKLKFAAAR